MARRPLNRMAKRAEAEAAERIKKTKAKEVLEEEGDEDEEESDDDDDGDDDDDDDSGDDEEESGSEDDEGDSDSEDDEGVRPKKNKAKKVPKVKVKKAKAPSKSAKSKKVTRMRAVWVVLSNNATKVASYEYGKEKEAREHAERLHTEKKQLHFVILVTAFAKNCCTK